MTVADDHGLLPAATPGARAAPTPERPAAAPTWWVRPGLDVRAGRLCVAGRDAQAIAHEHGTPLFVYDLAEVTARVRRVQAALAATGLPYRVRFALKAQREPEVLAALRTLGGPGSPGAVGIDVCSPGEVAWALEHGWRGDEISYTGTNLVDAELEQILAQPLKLNVDLLTQLRRVGRAAPGRRVGLRLNPRAGAPRIFVPAGRSPDAELQFGMYASEKPTKFGIYAEQLDEAVAIAREHDLTIDTVCFHICHQTHTEDLPRLDHALSICTEMIEHLQRAGCPIEEVNTGGGLGEPMMEGEVDLDLDAWADALAERLGPLGVTIATEPGEFLFSPSGVLLAEVATVEDRLGTTFVGLNVGWNTAALRFAWGEWVEIVPVLDPLAPRPRSVTVSGHINEAPDLFAEDYPFPGVREGDVVALLNVGGYCQAAAGRHCLRPIAPAVFFSDHA
jgi:diaminopimelate decarboxylase